MESNCISTDFLSEKFRSIFRKCLIRILLRMKEQKKKKYEAPETKKTQVELEDGICAASRTGEPVVDDKNDKVNISEQGHGGWNGIGDDISGEWQ